MLVVVLTCVLFFTSELLLFLLSLLLSLLMCVYDDVKLAVHRKRML